MRLILYDIFVVLVCVWGNVFVINIPRHAIYAHVMYCTVHMYTGTFRSSAKMKCSPVSWMVKFVFDGEWSEMLSFKMNKTVFIIIITPSQSDCSCFYIWQETLSPIILLKNWIECFFHFMRIVNCNSYYDYQYFRLMQYHNIPP